MIDVTLDKRLHQADYTLIRYQLRFEEDFSMPAYALLRLRRELSRVLKAGGTESLNHTDLLRPSLPTDPALLRQVQQPAPGFVLQVDSVRPHKFIGGDQLSLVVCFFAQGMLLIEPFSRLLDALGSVGLCRNVGRFHLESIEDVSGLSGNEQLWKGGPIQVTPTILDLTRKFEGLSPSSVTFEFQTPARLLKNSRPLFRPQFVEIFPFILRRVTGMLAVWANLEDIFDVGYLLECATRVDEFDRRFGWQDWRPLHRNEEAGGLSGSVTLGGKDLVHVWPVLKVGELFGIGKGAAFGAGRYHLIDSDMLSAEKLQV